MIDMIYDTKNNSGVPSMRTIWPYLIVFSAVLLTGCGGRGVDESRISDIESDLPTFQISAMHKAAQAGNYDYLAEQIELLSSEDSAVRFYAIMSLKKLTGTDNGYNYMHDSARRYEAVKRWRKWLAEYQPPETASE